MSKPYKRPVISAVFECIGGAAFIGGLFAFIAAWVDSSSGQSGVPGSIAGAVCILMAAAYVGIGQIISFLALASQRSEQISTLLVEEILPQLRTMEERLGSPPKSAPPETEL
jgi:hypothetical protein